MPVRTRRWKECAEFLLYGRSRSGRKASGDHRGLTPPTPSFRVSSPPARGPAAPTDSDMEMQTSHPDETARVVAAQAGDRRALEALLDARLPFVYTIVRRALSGSPEVDDVVQETMLRALRELPRLNHPESFRAWLAAITIRQISTHQHRWSRQTARTAALDEVPQDEAALAVQFEDATVLNLQVADQRGQLVRARQCSTLTTRPCCRCGGSKPPASSPGPTWPPPWA